MNKPVAWSYSSLNAFEVCPRRYQLTKVTKQVVEGQTEATLWGNRVHKALEDRVGKGVALPDTLKQFEPVAVSITNKRHDGWSIQCEQKMALTKDFRPTSWFGKGPGQEVWVRGITDVTLVKGDKAIVLDHKTGKPTPESAQLRLTAAMTFAHKPQVKTIMNSFLWLKHGTQTTEVFTRDDIPTIWQEFMPRVERLNVAMAENKFPPKPSGLCNKWCPVPKSLCQFSGKDG